MKKYLSPLKTSIMDPTNDISYYYAGHPYYTGANENTLQGKLEKKNGYNSQINEIGAYYHSGKVFPHIYLQNKEIDFNVWPNNVDVNYVNVPITSKLGIPATRIEGDEEHKNDWFTLFWDYNEVKKKWSPYDKKIVNQTLLKRAFIESKSVQINKWNTKEPIKDKWLCSEYYASNENRGMLKLTNYAAKKYWWGSSLYSLGGNSGSIVISPKFEIGGIISGSIKNAPYDDAKQVIIQSFVQPASNIIEGPKIITEGLKKQLILYNFNSILYNKKTLL